MRARFLQTAKEVLRRPQRFVAFGLVSTLAVMQFGVGPFVMSADAAELLPPETQATLMHNIRAQTKEVPYAGMDSNDFYEVMKRGYLGLVKLRDKHGGVTKAPEAEQHAFEKKFQDDIIKHAVAPYEDKQAQAAFNSKIRLLEYRQIVKMVDEFKGNVTPQVRTLVAGSFPVKLVVAPDIDKMFKPSEFEKTLFDDIFLVDGLGQSLGKETLEKVRLKILGHEAFHVGYEDLTVKKEKELANKLVNDDVPSFDLAEQLETLKHTNTMQEEAGADAFICSNYVELTGDVETVKKFWAARAVSTITGDLHHATQFELHKLIRQHDPSAPELGYLQPEQTFKAIQSLWRVFGMNIADGEEKQPDEILPKIRTSEEEKARQKEGLTSLQRIIEGKDLTKEQAEVLGNPDVQILISHAAEGWKLFNNIIKENGLEATVEAPKNWDGFKAYAKKIEKVSSDVKQVKAKTGKPRGLKPVI